jgi:signal transduction histidine kinase
MITTAFTKSRSAYTHGRPRRATDGATALRYIGQEALTNAFKHGNAHQMTITLDWSETALSLRAEDDGTPQLAPSSTGGGNGLRGMRERMEALGGTFSAGPCEEQGGFAVRISVPYQPVREKQAV